MISLTKIPDGVQEGSRNDNKLYKNQSYDIQTLIERYCGTKDKDSSSKNNYDMPKIIKTKQDLEEFDKTYNTVKNLTTQEGKAQDSYCQNDTSLIMFGSVNQTKDLHKALGPANKT